MEEIVNYTPSQEDIQNVKEIKDFLEETNIPYETDETFGVFHINDRQIQLRYIDSFYHRMDNSKRFGESCRGIKHTYFIDISHENLLKGIRTIWIFDFEMKQHNTIIDENGNEVQFRRQWEVIKNTIRTATRHIQHRFYARDCEVQVISNAELRNFLEKNCFYGYRSSNVNLGLVLKKDKNGFKKGTLMMVYTFGYNFYGNKNRQDNPFIEIVRVSTRLGCQVIGGASKCLTHFFENYPTLHIGDRYVDVKELKFYVDASHNDSRAMHSLGFKCTSWEGCGFMNCWLQDFDDELYSLHGKKGQIFQRKPQIHKRIMELIRDGVIASIANAGTAVFSTTKDEFLTYMQASDEEKQKILEHTPSLLNVVKQTFKDKEQKEEELRLKAQLKAEKERLKEERRIERERLKIERQRKKEEMERLKEQRRIEREMKKAQKESMKEISSKN